MGDRQDRHPWLDLLEVDGPFLSRPALDDVYDEAWPPKITNEHRDMLNPPASLPTEWDEKTMAQVDRVLTEVLGYREGRTLKFNPGTVIHPVYDNAAVSPHAAVFSRRDPDKRRLVVLAGAAASETPDSLDPAAITTHYGWPSTAVQRAALAARGLGADLALVTNGWQHLIVWVGSGITGYAWVDPSLYRLDRRLADAFVALLSAASITTDADTSTADLLCLSQEKQVDVTEKLGIQVRQAAEALVNAVSRANRNTDGKLLAGVAPNEVYAGVVTVLMRTVFLLNAEERELISSGDLWDRAYSVSGLLDQLDDDHYRHQGVMRRRHGAWLRLLAAARVVHGGVNHSQMNVPAYGGNLFEPTRYPFLEGVGVNGEVFDVGVVDDATTRHVLELLQRLGGQRLSYRAFSVEQIGQVYESLLDHSAVSVRDDTVVLGLVGTKGAEAEVELTDLEEQDAKGELAEWLAKNHEPAGGAGKVVKWQSRIDRTPDERVTATLSQACHGDTDVLARVERFASLLRTDARDVALVFLPGDVYVTETANRRDTGTAYTSPEFAAEIAHHALEYLVYEPGPHNEEDESKWQIKQPAEILRLRVCDPAVGSGAIVVAAVRFLADKLIESRLEHGELTARDLETAAADSAATDLHVQARRDVVSRCIYAVDRDPMAVEMAKLSLWLVTMGHGRPFTFLDHAIKCGDSLLGVTSLDQLRRLHLDESAGTQIGLDLDGGRAEGLGGYFTMIDERINKALALRDLIREGDVKDAADAQHRSDLNAKACRLLDDLRLVADAITAICYSNASRAKGSTELALREQLLPAAVDLESDRTVLERLASNRPTDAPVAFSFCHWALEFPEVMRRGGFSAVVGNPPFKGGSLISGAFGGSYRDHLVRYCAGGDSGRADLVCYFFRRVASIASSFGLIATNSISQGFSRRVALRPLVSRDIGKVHHAIASSPWPGRDSVYVALIWWAAARWTTSPTLDGKRVGGIESDLYPVGHYSGEPLPFPSRSGVAGEGQNPYGRGFVLDEQEVKRLVALDPRNEDVLCRYVSGLDINRSPDHGSNRWVINFYDWSLDRAREYPSVLGILEKEVKPIRAQDKRKQRRDYWWRYGEYRPSLIQRLAHLDRTIAVAKVSPHAIFTLLPTNVVFADKVMLFPWDDLALYGVLSSTIHRVWVDRYTGTLGTGVSYSPKDCFNNFPVPGVLSVSSDAARDGLEPSGTVTSDLLEKIRVVVAKLDEWRSEQLIQTGRGLTEIYSDYHDEAIDDAATRQLRNHHVDLDSVVCEAYGWRNLNLSHGFHDTRYGRYFTVSTEARFELLMRLLQSNFEHVSAETGRSLEAVLREAQQYV